MSFRSVPTLPVSHSLPASNTPHAHTHVHPHIPTHTHTRTPTHTHVHTHKHVHTHTHTDTSDFIPRRSRRSAHKKYVGHRTELGTFTCKPREWDSEEVAEFLRLRGFGDHAEAFQESEIDGHSLFLLGEQHLIERFNMKLGPALRLLDTISRLRHPPIV